MTVADKTPPDRTVERWDCICNGQFPSWGGYTDDGDLSLARWLARHKGPRCAPTQRHKAS